MRCERKGRAASGKFRSLPRRHLFPYQTANYRVEYTLAKSGVPRAWWRSVEHSTSGLSWECFVDELAAAAGTDPLEFRLRLIGGDRKIPDFTNPKEGKPLDTARLKGVLKLQRIKPVGVRRRHPELREGLQDTIRSSRIQQR